MLIRAHALVFLALATVLPPSAARAQSPFPSSVGFVESTTPPIRVYYADLAKAELAATVLEAAKTAWTAQVDDMGFAPPVTLDDALAPMVGTRIYLQHRSDIGGMAQAVANLPATPATDCATILLVADGLPASTYGATVFHEFHHAVEMATDCVESMFAYEQITVAVTAVRYPDDWLLPTVVSDFQQAPNHSLDWLDAGSYYHFGAALFSVFLDQVYGAGDGTLLADIWSHTPQEGTVVISGGMPGSATANEPDLLDAMRATLSERGQSFDDAFADFSVYRYFTGSLDDGAHLTGAGAWSGSEVRLDARHFTDELPLVSSLANLPPEDLGSSYVAFELNGASPDAVMRLAFTGGGGVSWRVSALATGSGEATVLPMTLDPSNSGTLLVPMTEGLKRVVLVAANLGTPDHDPDDMDWESTPFAYSAALLSCGAMTLAGAEPGAATEGDSTVVTFDGSGFPDGQLLTATVSGDGVSVSRVVRRDATTVDVTLDVADGAAAGERQLTIQSECGASATGSIRIEGAGGCASMRPSIWLLVGVLGALALRSCRSAGAARRRGPTRACSTAPRAPAA